LKSFYGLTGVEVSVNLTIIQYLFDPYRPEQAFARRDCNKKKEIPQ